MTDTSTCKAKAHVLPATQPQVSNKHNKSLVREKGSDYCLSDKSPTRDNTQHSNKSGNIQRIQKDKTLKTPTYTEENNSSAHINTHKAHPKHRMIIILSRGT